MLATRGVKAGDRVALAIGNSWAFAVALLAGWKLGATVAPLDPLLKSEERADILADLGPAILVGEGDVEAHGAVGECPAPTCRPPSPGRWRRRSFSTRPGARAARRARCSPTRRWRWPSSRGPDRSWRSRPSDVVLAILPLAHSFGLNGALLAPLLTGATVALVERFAPDAVVAAVRRQRVTVFPGVATMFRRLLDSAELAAADLSSLRLAVSGAAPCPWELATEWRARTGIRIVRGYGMTELFRPISYLATDTTESPHAIGRAVPGVEARIVESGAAVSSGSESLGHGGLRECPRRDVRGPGGWLVPHR